MTSPEPVWTSIDRFLSTYELRCGPEQRLLDISSELGEVGKEILKSSDYGKKRAEVTPELREEIGDLLYSVCALAVECGLDPEERLAAALKKYERRMTEKGHIGSGQT